MSAPPPHVEVVAYALGLLDPEDHQAFELHLVECASCQEELRELALASEQVQRVLDGRGIRTVIVRAPKLVNIVPA